MAIPKNLQQKDSCIGTDENLIVSKKSPEKFCKKETLLRTPLFEYPAIPEINLCIITTIGAIIYGWYCVYQASQKYTFKIGDAASISVLPLFGQRFKVSG